MFDQQKLYWAPDFKEGYVLAKVVDIGADHVKLAPLSDPKNIITSPYERVLQSELYEKYPDDNCALMFVNEATLLNNIRQRYMMDKIYTYVAHILIVVNPYFQIKGLYSIDLLKQYVGKSLGVLSPHVFGMADKAYRDWKTQRCSQAIVVSGESGSGKTETTKHVLKYLTENYGAHAGTVERQIIESNPLLEAFGNAKTLRNNNSSRFGKFIEIYFNKRNLISGGSVVHYLLEKTRVIRQCAGERNFHIFYRLCAGAPVELRRRLYLEAPDKYNYLKHGCTRYFLTNSTIHNVSAEQLSEEFRKHGGLTDIQMDDIQDFHETSNAMDAMGIDQKTRENIFAILAGILHLGNIEFDEAECQGGSCTIRSTSQSALQKAGYLLGLTGQLLTEALTVRLTKAPRGSGINVSEMDELVIALRPDDAANARDALAKDIYSRLFEYLVKRVNEAIPKLSESDCYIGILDIAGFEYFEQNSFEQFCINYCNEKLQQFFNERILKEEQIVYAREGLNVKKIHYIDNQDCIDLIESKVTGIIDLLDEVCKLPKPSNTYFASEVHKKNKAHIRLDIPRKSKFRLHRELRDDEGFIIRHFAGAVCYATAGFTEKNNDALHASLECCVAKSEDKLVQHLFDPSFRPSTEQKHRLRSTNAGKLNFVSVGSNFRTQLNLLLEKLRGTGTNFIRCIKPNSNMAAHEFVGSACLSQLQFSGVTDVLALMEQGYPSRTKFDELYDLYASRLPPHLSNLPPRIFCMLLFKALGLDSYDYKFGLSRVFFRPGKFAEFDRMLTADPKELAESIKKISTWLLQYRWRKAQYCTLSVIKLKNKIKWRAQMYIRIQTAYRGWHSRRKFAHLIRGLTRIRQAENRLKAMSDSYSKMVQFKQIGLEEISKLVNDAKELRTSIYENRLTNPAGLQLRVDTLLRATDAASTQLRSRADKDMATRQEAERASKELERQRRAEEEEAKRKQRAEEAKAKQEAEKQARLELERRRVMAEEEARRQAHEQARLAREAEEAAQKRAAESYRSELERRDRELALRIAENNDEEIVEELKVSKLEAVPNSKYQMLINWSYTKLRDTINTSCDIELIEACRDELHRRIHAYQEWTRKQLEQKGKDRKALLASSRPLGVPEEIWEYASKGGTVLPNATRNPDEEPKPPIDGKIENRYFRIPFTVSGVPSKGSNWWVHFEGRYVARQMEIYEGQPPTLLVAGVHDILMCELPLESTGLTRKKGAEILASEFEREWIRHGGNNILQRFADQLSSIKLRELVAKLPNQENSARQIVSTTKNQPVDSSTKPCPNPNKPKVPL